MSNPRIARYCARSPPTSSLTSSMRFSLKSEFSSRKSTFPTTCMWSSPSSQAPSHATSYCAILVASSLLPRLQSKWTSSTMPARPWSWNSRTDSKGLTCPETVWRHCVIRPLLPPALREAAGSAMAPSPLKVTPPRVIA
eukprot:4819302-Pyramimonas_sp.AAC.1